MTPRTVVDFYLDPACPWAWRTSLSMREVARVRPVDVRWKCLSLEEINRVRGTLREAHQASRAPFRALVLARRTGGQPAIDRLYAALGAARHDREDQAYRSVTSEAPPSGSRATVRIIDSSTSRTSTPSMTPCTTQCSRLSSSAMRSHSAWFRCAPTVMCGTNGTSRRRWDRRTSSCKRL